MPKVPITDGPAGTGRLDSSVPWPLTAPAIVAVAVGYVAWKRIGGRFAPAV